MRDKRIIVPVDEKMHDDVTAHVEKAGLDSVAAYIRMLIRSDLATEKRLEEMV